MHKYICIYASISYGDNISLLNIKFRRQPPVWIVITLSLIARIIYLAIIAGALYVIYHFVMKYW